MPLRADLDVAGTMATPHGITRSVFSTKRWWYSQPDESRVIHLETKNLRHMPALRPRAASAEVLVRLSVNTLP